MPPIFIPSPCTSDFLQRGYFPKELPPLFDTFSFCDLAKSIPVPDHGSLSSSPVRFSHSKYSSIRRELSIPNPYQYFQLSDFLASKWTDLENGWVKSFISKTKPEISASRAVEGASQFADLPAFRAETRSSGRYLFKADISSFYHSIYSHSIPWALHGKATAKANRDWRPSSKNPPVLWGNIADLLVRNLQDGQTVGLPIGPDTSFVVAETILCGIDVSLQNKLAGIPGFRFIDDYEFVCSTRPEAERALAVLQDSLAGFQLRLNPRKTTIVELPVALDTPWVEGLGGFDLGTSTELSTRLIRYFTRAFELARSHPGEPVLSYATKRLAGLAVDDQHSKLLQQLLLQAAVADPGILRFVLRVFYEHRVANLPVDNVNLGRALNQLALRHAPLGHGSEVAWCIWAAAVFGEPLNLRAAKEIESMSDDIVALTAMFAAQHGAFDSPPSFDYWRSLADSSSLFDEHWLLGYEAIGQGWIPSPNSGDPAKGNSFFESLRANDVHFVDSVAELEIPSIDPASIYP